MKKWVSLMLVVILIVNCTILAFAVDGAISLGDGVTNLSLSECSSSDATTDGELRYNKYCTYNFNLATSGSYKVSIVAKAATSNLLGTILIGTTEKFTSPIPVSTDMQTTELGVVDLSSGSQTFKFGIKYTPNGTDSLFVDGFVFERVGDPIPLTLAGVSSGVTSNKPASGMNANAYANYTFTASEGEYEVYATVMANAGEREITASLGETVIGAKSFTGIGWDSRYSREYLIGTVALTEGSHTITYTNTGSASFRLWSVRLKKVVEPTTDETTIYVSPTGSDENNGLSSASPLKTLEAAISKVSEVNTDSPRNIIISLADGEYVPQSTIVLDEDFSSLADYSIKFISQDSSNPAVISGGYDVTGWTDTDNDGIYVSDIIPDSISDVRQLYIDKNSAQRARSEEYIYGGDDWDDTETTAYAQDGFYVANDMLPTLTKPEDVEIAYSVKWALQRLPVDSITDNGDGTSIVKMTQPYYSTAYTMICGGGVQPKPFNKIYFENDLSLLDREGEFYFDKEERRIYYKPFEQENLSTARTVVPKLEQLISAKGSSADNKIYNITFDNIDFIYGGYYTEPNTEGAVAFQAECLVDADKGLNKAPNSVGRNLHAQIEFENAENINFINCNISCMGSTALRLGSLVTDSSISGCVISDVGGSALSIGDWNATETNLAENIEITNNVVSHVGLDFMSSPAISVYYAKNVDILHNDISDTPYSGMSIGWGWAWDYNLSNDVKTDTPSFANRAGVGGHNISYNKIDGVSGALNDGGHIYNLGYMTETLVTNNYLLNSPDAGGVYLDTGASNLTITNNVFVNCDRDSIAYGRSEHAVNNVAQNNWSNTPQVKTTSWPGTGCVFNAPTLITDGNWPTEAEEVMDAAGLESGYTANLSAVQKPSWRTLDFFAHLENEKLPEGSIAINLKDWAACRLNNTAASAPTFDNIYRHYTLENMYPRDAIIYEFDAPAAGEYYLEIGYSTTGTYTAAVAVNKNLKQNHYNSTTGTYVWNKAGCTYFDSSNSTTEKFALVPSNSSSPIGRIYRIASPYALNAGTNELYLGCTSISGASTVTIKSLRFIPVSE